MPYRTTPLINGNYYHIYNRGVERRDIFQTDNDRNRFLKTIFYYQYIGPKPRFSRFNPEIHKNLSKETLINIIAYCLMPNHFHLLIKQNKDNGISEYTGKISNSYTKYFNTKYRRVGPLLQGSFKSVLVESDEQIIHLSRYIHLNPYVAGLIKNLKDYSWSSYNDYLNNSSRVIKEEILNFFKSAKDYENFVLDYQDYALALANIKHQLIDVEAG